MNWLAAAHAISTRAHARACSNETCRSTTWTRWQRRRDGILLQDKWYCGAGCFQVDLQVLLNSLSDTSSSSRYRPHRLPLGLLMLARGVINQNDLGSALERKRRFPEKRIGRCLQELGLTTQTEIARAVGIQHCLPVLFLPKAERDEDVPFRLQQASAAICFRKTNNSKLMYVGFTQEVDLSLTSAIAAVLELKVEPCIVSAGHEASERSPEDVTGRRERVFEAIYGSFEISRSICSYANQFGVDSVRVGITSSYLWAHLSTPAKTMNLLFRRGDRS